MHERNELLLVVFQLMLNLHLNFSRGVILRMKSELYIEEEEEFIRTSQKYIIQIFSTHY